MENTTNTENKAMDNALEQRRVEMREDAYRKLDDLFGEGACDSGFDRECKDRVLCLLREIASCEADGLIWSASIRIDEITTAKVALSAKGIKVERRETKGAAL